MPTKVQRLNVTVTEEQRALLFELARLEGTSASGLVRGFIDQATPMLRAAVPILRKAAQQTEMAQEEADRIIGQVFREVVDAQQMDLLDDDWCGRATTNAPQRAGASEDERRRSPAPSSED